MAGHRIPAPPDTHPPQPHRPWRPGLLSVTCPPTGPARLPTLVRVAGRRYTVPAGHLVLAMAALAVCVTTAW